MTDEIENGSSNAPTAAPGRRRYNRRTDSAEGSPPYFEVFERIATALEGIAETLPRVSPPTEIRLPQDAADVSSSSRDRPAGRSPRH